MTPFEPPDTILSLAPHRDPLLVIMVAIQTALIALLAPAYFTAIGLVAGTSEGDNTHTCNQDKSKSGRYWDVSCTLGTHVAAATGTQWAEVANLVTPISPLVALSKYGCDWYNTPLIKVLEDKDVDFNSIDVKFYRNLHTKTEQADTVVLADVFIATYADMAKKKMTAMSFCTYQPYVDEEHPIDGTWACTCADE